MNYKVVETPGRKFIECLPGKILISSEGDALDWVSICGEHQAGGLLLHTGNLSEDFFHLSTGLAGAVLQKFINYRLRVAAVLPPERVEQGKFKDMVLEANRGSQFRVFSTRSEAETWLLL